MYNPNLLSSPLRLVLFLSKIFTFYIPKRIYAHIREGKKSEREFREREIEREIERECVYLFFFFFWEKRGKKQYYIIAERNDDDEFFTDGVLETWWREYDDE